MSEIMRVCFLQWSSGKGCATAVLQTLLNARWGAQPNPNDTHSVVSGRGIHHQRNCNLGFTLIELVVVVAIVGILVSLLATSLSSAKEKGKSALCLSNLRQVGIAASIYAQDNGDRLHQVNGAIPDQGQWLANPWTEQPLFPEHPDAYWGVAYSCYSGATKQLFRCPGARRVDEWREEGLPYPSEFWLNSTYGINRYLVTPFAPETVGPQKLTSLKSPQTTILAQDAAEQRLEGRDDSLGLFPGQTEILGEWRFGLQRLYPEREMWREWYRHGNRDNTLWLPGHVTSIPFNGFDRGVDYRWYTGEIPLEQPR
jgi:prepilin-type N-terminal cleavage/methylation domain-containing protein